MPRLMQIATPLGDDVLLFHRMHAREEMAQLFEYQVDLLSAKDDLDPDKILGKNVTISLAVGEDATRFFNGYVTRFAQTGGREGRYHRYAATVRPWLWFLTRTADCRIFQDMTVPDIVKEVFKDHPTADYKLELTGTYRKSTYCVQYRETDFNFVSRLLENEGIYYYFRHTDGHNTMVLADSTSKHDPAEGCEKLSFVPPDQLVKDDFEHVSAWDFSREIQPGVYVHDDYDLERPGVELKTSKTLPRQYSPSDYEVYDYPGDYVQTSDGEQYAAIRIDELGTQFETSNAECNARGLSVGCLLTLEDHPRGDQNREYLVLGATYALEFSDYEALGGEEGGAEYQCSFVAMSSKQQFRPRRATPKPIVQGPQTAVVVGPSGDEIHTDKYGRVRVQFHWDRRGKKNEKSSCWIRVSQPWAGKAWGGVAIPRMGQEVIVDFLEGDPDQPIITGRVYNAEQMPPYDLPANATQTGIKTRSSKGGGADNCNEIRFEDKSGSEQLFIHAEKNQDIEVENDETHWVGHDRKKTIDHDETTHVKHDRTETVDHDEAIAIGNNQKLTVHVNRVIDVGKDHTEAIHGSMGLSVDKTKSETVAINSAETVGAAKELSVGGIYQVTVGGAHNTTVGAAMTEEVGGLRAEAVGGPKTVAVGGNHSMTVGGSNTLTVGKDGSLTIAGKLDESVKKEYTLKAKTITIQAEEEILISVGQAKIAMKKDGTVLVEGKDLSLKASGKINQKASGDIILKGSKIAEN